MVNFFGYEYEEEELPPMDPVEAEVDAIRQQIYEQTKHMTTEERIADLIKRTDPIIKKYHIRISKMKPIPPYKRPPEEEDD